MGIFQNRLGIGCCKAAVCIEETTESRVVLVMYFMLDLDCCMYKE